MYNIKVTSSNEMTYFFYYNLQFSYESWESIKNALCECNIKSEYTL